MDLNALDAKLFYQINQSTNGFFDIVMPFLSNKGYLLVLPFGVFIVWQALRQPADKRRDTLHLAIWAIALAVISFLLADWMSNELKQVFNRLRPCHALEGVRLLGGCTQSTSMPSGHSTNSFAYAVPLFFVTRGYIKFAWRLYPLILAAAVAYSRPYLGVHYPGDIAAGALLGTLCAAATIALFTFARLRYAIRPRMTLMLGSLFVIAIFRIFYILRGPLDLSPVEAWYWQLSAGVAAAGQVASPLLIVLIGISTSVLGDAVFGIRIFALFFSLLSSYIIFRLVVDMYGDETAALGAALLMQAIPLFSILGLFMTPASPLVFFWSISLWILYRAVTRQQVNQSVLPAEWILLGVSVGLGVLIDGSMILFPLGMMVFLSIADRRSQLKTIKPYASILISLCCVLLWGAVKGWAGAGTFAGQFSGGFGTDLSTSGILRFVALQTGMVTPIILVVIFISLHKLFYRERGLQSDYLFAFSIPVLAVSLAVNLFINNRIDWTLTGYITGIIAAAFFLLRPGRASDHDSAGKNYLRYLAYTGLLLSVIATAILHFPSVIKLPTHLDPTNAMKGWRALGTEVSAAYEQQKKNGPVIIASDSCSVSGELAYYVKGHPGTYCASINRYAKKGDSVIFVMEGDAELPTSLNKAFESFDKKICVISQKKVVIKAYSIFICYNFIGPETALTDGKQEQR
jgi:undecaprenyl-diphosphatase